MFKEIMAVLAVVAFSVGVTWAISYKPTASEAAVQQAQQEFASHITGCYTDHNKEECLLKDAAATKMETAIKADRNARPEAYKPY